VLTDCGIRDRISLLLWSPPPTYFFLPEAEGTGNTSCSVHAEGQTEPRAVEQAFPSLVTLDNIIATNTE
jgi:hypothetical protein